MTKPKAEYLDLHFSGQSRRPNNEKLWLWPNTLAFGRPLFTNGHNFLFLGSLYINCAVELSFLPFLSIVFQTLIL